MGTSATPVTPVIRLHDVTVTVGHSRHVALSGATLDIHNGEVLAIVGRSGAGKSTMLKAIAGIVHADGGSITGPDGGALPRTALVFQDPELMPWLTVAHNVAFSLRLASHPNRLRHRRDRHAAATDILERLDLADLADRYPTELSGGQQQRVAIARAVAAKPDVVLLDEPFSALDPATRSALQDWVVGMRHLLAPTVVLVTHDLAEALYTADRIALVHASGDTHSVPVWTSDVTTRNELDSSRVRAEIASHFIPSPSPVPTTSGA